MALRDQPYLPLYIHDIMVDEKLNECCAATHGIYIKGLMCLMHKSKEYGKILLKQKYKQNGSMCLNFAYQLSKHLPYTVDEIEKAITELINEEVCYFDGDYLCQKRMIKDNEISLARSKAGKKGGGNPNFVSNFVKTKIQTNSEYEYEYNNTLSNDEKKQKCINWIMSVFGFNEIKNADKFKEAFLFVNILTTDKKFDEFIIQFKAYIQFKKQSAEKIHSFPKFIGTIEKRYLDGGWNSRNWVMELERINKVEVPKLPPLREMSR